MLKFQNFPYEASNITGSPNFVCPQNVQVEIFDFKVLKVFVIRMKILSSDILNRFITHDGTHRISTVSTPYKSLYKLYSIPNIPRFNPYRDSSL